MADGQRHFSEALDQSHDRRLPRHDMAGYVAALVFLGDHGMGLASVSRAGHRLNRAASLAAWIVLCAVPGTQGVNRYGPDPLGGEGAHEGAQRHSTLSPQ